MYLYPSIIHPFELYYYQFFYLLCIHINKMMINKTTYYGEKERKEREKGRQENE